MTKIEVGMKVRVLEDCGGTDRSYIGEVLEVVDITSNNLVELSNGWYYFPYRLEAVEVKRCDSVKVGDVVRVTKLWAHNEYVKVGDIAKVIKLYDDGDILVTLDDEHYAVVSGYEKATKSTQKVKIGDRVRILKLYRGTNSAKVGEVGTVVNLYLNGDILVQYDGGFAFDVVTEYEKVENLEIISPSISPGDYVKLLRVARYEEGGFRGGHFPETDKKYIGKIGKVDSEHGEYGYRVVFEDGVVALAPAFALKKVKSCPKFRIGDVVRIVGPSEYHNDFTGRVTWPVKIIEYDEHQKLYKVATALYVDGDWCILPESSLEIAVLKPGDWVKITGPSVTGVDRIGKYGKIEELYSNLDYSLDIGVYKQSNFELVTHFDIVVDGVKQTLPVKKLNSIMKLLRSE